MAIFAIQTFFKLNNDIKIYSAFCSEEKVNVRSWSKKVWINMSPQEPTASKVRRVYLLFKLQLSWKHLLSISTDPVYFWHHTVEIFSPISVLVSLEDFLLELGTFVVMLPRFDGLVGLFLYRKKTAVSRMRHCEWTVFFLNLFFCSTGKNESHLKHKTFSRKVKLSFWQTFVNAIWQPPFSYSFVAK